MGNFFDDPWGETTDAVEDNWTYVANPGYALQADLADDQEINSSVEERIASIGEVPETGGSTGSPNYSYEAPDYSEYFDAMAENLAAQQAIAERQLEIAEQQAAMAMERYDWWKENFLPSINDLIEQAETGIDTEYTADLAGNRVRLNYDAANEATQREMERLGVNPMDELYTGLDDSMQRQEAAAEVDARNNARTSAIDANQQLQLQVAAMGLGVPTSSLQSSNASSQTLADSAATRNAGAATIGTANANVATAQQQATMNANQAAYNQQQLNNEAAFNANMNQAQYNNAMFQSFGTFAGMGLGAMGSGQQQQPAASTAPQAQPYQYSTPPQQSTPMPFVTPNYGLSGSGPLYA